jgi:hypothetical protein
VLRWLDRGYVEEEKGGLSWPESHRTRELRCRKVGWSGRVSRQAGRQPLRAGTQPLRAGTQPAAGSPAGGRKITVLVPELLCNLILTPELK